jgi:mono/diheme cytochrome c family protein
VSVCPVADATIITVLLKTRLKLLLSLTAAGVLAAVNAYAQDNEIARGQYLIYAGGCISCHTEDVDEAVPLAGGRAMESPFGTFYTPNITPDVDSGIGGWSDDDFVNAFWNGVSPDDEHYFPAFPFTSYTGVSRDDVLAMKAYLFSIDAVSKQVSEHDLAWYIPTRIAAGAWKKLNFDSARFVPDANQSERWNRGAYLVRHLGHCGECHTPRSSLGVLEEKMEMAGSRFAGEAIPNITQHRVDGIGRWSVSDIEYFLDIGMLPDGDFSGSSMGAVIEDNTSKLTREDRLAIAAYLKAVPPRETP